MLRNALPSPSWAAHCQVQSASEQVVETVEQVDQQLHEVGSWHKHLPQVERLIMVASVLPAQSRSPGIILAD